MTYEDFDEQMDDILSSGQGSDLSNWHKNQLKELFGSFPNKELAVEYANTYYSTIEPEYIREEELDYIASLLDKKPKTSITFE